MTIAYFDCFSGVAGDMILGAFVDLGLPLSYLKKEIARLPLGDYELKLVNDKRAISGTNISVVVNRGPKERCYSELDEMISRSGLKKNVKVIAREIFSTLAKAEAKVHGNELNHVHFHEVGAADSVIDVVGAALGFDHFGFDGIFSSPLPITRGRIRCLHGLLPVPAPATIEILKGVPLEPSPVKDEIVTPTGAAVLKTMVQHFGESPIQEIDGVGYGFGDKIFPDIPNALRIVTGKGFQAVEIQCNIDDMNPELFAYAVDRIFEAGAVDCDLTPIQMKKNRPAIKLTAIAQWDKKDPVIATILRETTTFGVRYWPIERRMLVRELKTRKVKSGSVTFKIGIDNNGKAIKAVPEFEDVKRLAIKSGRSIVAIYQELSVDAKKLLR